MAQFYVHSINVNNLLRNNIQSTPVISNTDITKYPVYIEMIFGPTIALLIQNYISYNEIPLISN